MSWLKFWRKKVVLGQQLADAEFAEAERLSQGDPGPSPVPSGDYRLDQGEYSLLNVSTQPLDIELRDFVNRFASMNSEDRSAARDKISMDEQYKLIQFAKRSAVLALRERNIETCEQGLLALAVIDENRIDSRDASWAAGLLGHSAITLVGATSDAFARAMSISTSGMAKIIGQQRRREHLSSWGYSEVQTPDGVGFIRCDFSPYEPSVDLTSIAIEVAAELDKGRYVAEPEIASEIPSIWFPKFVRSSSEVSLGRALGTVKINGHLRKDATEKAVEQMFVLWIAELPTEEDAKELASWIGNGVDHDQRFAVAFVVGRLFGLAVAGSSHIGTKSFESIESLNCLLQPIEDQLSKMDLK